MIIFCLFSTKVSYAFLPSEIIEKLTKRFKLPDYWSDTGYKGTVVNQVCPSLHTVVSDYITTMKTTFKIKFWFNKAFFEFTSCNW